jgi:hypothetical protein
MLVLWSSAEKAVPNISAGGIILWEGRSGSAAGEVPGEVIQDSGGGNKFCLRFFLDFGSDKNEYASSNEHIAPLLILQNFRRGFGAHIENSTH